MVIPGDHNAQVTWSTYDNSGSEEDLPTASISSSSTSRFSVLDPPTQLLSTKLGQLQ